MWAVLLLTALVASPVASEEVCNLRDVLFILDSSNSLRSTGWANVQSFVKSVGARLTLSLDETRVAMIYFGNSSHMHFKFDLGIGNTNFVYAVEAIQWLQEETGTASALEMARTQIFVEANGDRPDVPDVAILLTDGRSNVNPANTIPQATNLKNAGVELFVFGIVSPDLDVSELEAMASDPIDSHVFLAPSTSELESFGDNMKAVACGNDPLTSECEQVIGDNGFEAETTIVVIQENGNDICLGALVTRRVVITIEECVPGNGEVADYTVRPLSGESTHEVIMIKDLESGLTYILLGSSPIPMIPSVPNPDPDRRGNRKGRLARMTFRAPGTLNEFCALPTSSVTGEVDVQNAHDLEYNPTGCGLDLMPDEVCLMVIEGSFEGYNDLARGLPIFAKDQGRVYVAGFVTDVSGDGVYVTVRRVDIPYDEIGCEATYDGRWTNWRDGSDPSPSECECETWEGTGVCAGLAPVCVDARVKTTYEDFSGMPQSTSCPPQQSYIVNVKDGFQCYTENSCVCHDYEARYKCAYAV